MSPIDPGWRIRASVNCVIKVSVNSLAPGRCQRNFRKVNVQLNLVIDGWSISCKIVLKWMPMDLTDGKSTLVQVMAWCRQATSHYLSHCWPRSRHMASLGHNGLCTRDNALNYFRINVLMNYENKFNKIFLLKYIRCQKMHPKMSSAIWRPFCFSLNVLKSLLVDRRFH